MVFDTNIVVSALRSPRGASAALLFFAQQGAVAILASTVLALEYETICFRREHLEAAGLTAGEAMVFLDGLMDMVHPVEASFTWRPPLSDPADEMVLEVAVNGRADAIVIFDRKDFEPANRLFGLEILSPVQAIRRLT